MPEKIVAPRSPPIKTREEAESAIELMARLEIAVTKETEQKQKAELQAQAVGKKIQGIKSQQQEHEARLKDWCERNRAQVFGDSKTAEFRHGFLKFRLGSPAIKLLKGWTNELVIKALSSKARFKNCLRIKKEVDRARIEEGFQANKFDKKDLASVGLERKAEESFSVELKLTTVQ